MHSFRQFKNHNSEREHENLKNDPIFSAVCFVSQNSFSCGPPFSSFWSVKYLSFWAKDTDSESSVLFLESRHLEVTKSIFFFVHLPELNTHFFRLQLMAYLFCLDLKITISVFFTLSEILFAFNQ